MKITNSLHCDAAVALTILSSGCRSYWPLSKDLQDRIEVEAAFGPSIEDDAKVVAVGKTVTDGTDPWPEDFELPEQSTWKDYVILALERNPAIRARVRDLQALGLRVPQVTSLPDPSLTIIPPTSRQLETAAGQMNGGLGISQGIPFPSKLAARGDVAERIVHLAFENLDAEKLRVVAQVKAAYFAYYFAEMAIKVTRENEEFLRQFRDVAETRYRAGSAPQQDLLRAEVDLYNLSNELITLEQQRDTARAHLNVLMDRDVRAALPAPPRFDPLEFGWKLEGLLARAVAENPRLKALQERVQVDLEARELALLQYYPDFSIGGILSFITGGLSPVANGRDAWSVALGVTLPVWWHRIRAGVLESNANIFASSLRYRGLRNDVFFAIQDLFVRIDSAYRRAVLFRDGILPRARQTVDVSEANYRAGQVEFLTLVDNWRKLLDFTLDYYRALTDLERSFAEMEEIVGGSLPRTETEQ